jgi:hypothetical protein
LAARKFGDFFCNPGFASKPIIQPESQNNETGANKEKAQIKPYPVEVLGSRQLLYEALCGHEGSSQFFRKQRQDQMKRHQCVWQKISVRLKLRDYNLNICVFCIGG